jgi:hypothetical protein
MFVRNTSNAAHSARTSLALKNAEEEFGALKRRLDRREVQRRAASEYNDDPSTVMRAGVTTVSADGSALSGGDGLRGGRDIVSVSRLMDSSTRCQMESIPLFTDDASKMEVVHAAHKRHNRAIVEHLAQWDQGRKKIAELVQTSEASRTELESVISAAKEVQNADPPVVDSATCTSNYYAIRETIRQVAACGNNIDDSDVSPNDFDFLLSDTSLSAREKVMLQRIRDLSAKLKSTVAALASAKEASVQDKMRYDAELNDLRETHRDEAVVRQQEWDDHREGLESDLAHWKASSASLQQALEGSRQQLELEREAAKSEMATVLVQHKDEVARWMQTVAMGDREKHTLRESLRELELHASGSSTELDRLQVALAAVQNDLDTTRRSRDEMQSNLTTLEIQLGEVTRDVTTLRAAKPSVADAMVHVDTNVLIAEMRDSLTTARPEMSRLRLGNDNLQKKCAAQESELRLASACKGKLEEAEIALSTTSMQLTNVTGQQLRDHKRRIELVCENYCLRSMIVVLQRPNGFGERMEHLENENRWLMEKLERVTPLRVVKQTRAVTGAASSDHLMQQRLLVERHEGDGVMGNERDVVLHIADMCTQTAPGCTPLNSGHLMWKAACTQCSEDVMERDLMADAELRSRAAMARYMSSSEAHKNLQTYASSSRAIQMASHRFRRSLSDEYTSVVRTTTADASHRGGDAGDHLRTPAGYGAGACDDEEDSLMSSSSSQSPPSRRDTLNAQQQRPPRPVSAQSATTSCAERRSTTQDCPSSEPHGHHAVKSTLGNGVQHSPWEPQLLRGTDVPSFCVLGVHDAPQKSALSGNPTNYFSMKRSHGLAGASGKQREYDLQQHTSLERVVIVAAPEGMQANGGAPDPLRAGPWISSNCPSTHPIRTMGEQPLQRPRSSSLSRDQPGGSGASRPRSALLARSTAPMSAFMPAQRAALGSWKPRDK